MHTPSEIAQANAEREDCVGKAPWQLMVCHTKTADRAKNCCGAADGCQYMLFRKPSYICLVAKPLGVWRADTTASSSDPKSP